MAKANGNGTAIAAPELWPGMPDQELAKWAAARQLKWAIDLPIREYSDGKGFRWAPVLWDYPHVALRYFLTMSKTDSRWGYEVHHGFGAYLIAALQERAKAQKSAIEAEVIPDPPSDPSLARAYATLLAVRSQARETSAPFPPEGTTRLAVRPDPPQLVVSVDPPVSSHSRRETVTTIWLDRTDDLDSTVCSCDQKGCRHLILACDRWLATVSAPRPTSLADAVRAALAVPAWERALLALDQAFITGGVQQVLEQDESRVGWRIDLARHEVRVVPLLCTPKVRGGYKTKVTTKAELEPLLLRSSPVDRAIADSLDLRPEHTAYGRQSGRDRRAVLKLAGHPRVYLKDGGVLPRNVVVTRLALSVSQEPDGSVVLGITCEGVPTSPRSLLGLLSMCAPDPYVALSPDETTIEVTPIPNGLMPILNTLAERGGRFPAEALPALVRRLPAFNAVAEVQTSGLRGMLRLPPNATPVAQLELVEGDALILHLRTRPLVGADLQVPASGSVELFADAKGVVHTTERQMANEAAAAARVRAEIPPGDPLEDEPMAWRYPEGHDAMLVIEGLRELGDAVTVEWTGQRVTVSSPATVGQLKVQVGSAENWFGLRGQIDADGTKVSLSEVLGALRRGQRFIKVEGGVWLRLEDSLRKQLEALALASTATKDGDALAPVHGAALRELENAGAKVQASKPWTEWVANMNRATTLEPELPAVQASLRPYQEAGVRWVLRLAEWAGGAVLADDMGLGKTLQALCVLAARGPKGPALVITPTSVSFNWIREAEKFTPNLKLHLHRGADRSESLDHLGPLDVLVTSYDLALRDVDTLNRKWATLVLDESQAVKNANTLRAQAIKKIDADLRLALSGTPVENRLSELWSLFSIVLPGLFGGWTEFSGRFASPIERHGDNGRRESLARMLRPFILRRLKREVATELPAREEVRIDVVLSTAERALYDKVRVAALDMMAGDDDTPAAQRRFKILAAITRLRQIACHPRLCEPGSIAGSAKMEALLQLVGELRDGGRRALVFSQFTEHLALARESLDLLGLSYRYLDGSTPEKQRRAEVDAFQAGEGDLFLLSLKAGGTGLNLTAATDVIILDPWWNPAVEDQAADRAHRIGQTRKVTVWRLVATETIEEQILSLHAKKRDLVAGVLDGTGQSGAMSVEELMSLLKG